MSIKPTINERIEIIKCIQQERMNRAEIRRENAKKYYSIKTVLDQRVAKLHVEIRRLHYTDTKTALKYADEVRNRLLEFDWTLCKSYSAVYFEKIEEITDLLLNPVHSPYSSWSQKLDAKSTALVNFIKDIQFHDEGSEEHDNIIEQFEKLLEPSPANEKNDEISK